MPILARFISENNIPLFGYTIFNYFNSKQPNWLIVLKAIILFKSFCTKLQVAAKNAVLAPTRVITNKAVGLYSNNGLDLTNKYNPAVTRVAAWIKADTGVGNFYI